MSSDHEENLLEQALRDAFRDYDLPASEHPRVWAGVEERIAALPAARRRLPYRVVVPVTAVLGVAVGWLLPHPAPQPAPSPPVPAVQAVARPIAQMQPVPSAAAPAMAPTAAVPEVLVSPATASRLRASSRKATVIYKSPKPGAQPQPIAQAMPTLALPADSAVSVAPTDSSQPASSTSIPPAAFIADSTPTLVSNPNAPNQAAYLAAASEHAAKPVKEESKEKTLLYRKPTHRQPERGNGVRRWFSHLTQGLRHLLGA